MSGVRWGSVGLSVVVVLALVVWLASGDIRSAEDEAPQRDGDTKEALASVQVESRLAGMFRPRVQVQGQVEPWQRLEVRARLGGVVEQLQVALGEEVEKGDPLLTLSDDDRPAAVAGSRARVRQLEAELAAADRLRSERLVSESEKLRLESELSAARAELRQATLATEYLEPEAPFAGTINARHVEEGTFVQAGEPLFELVQVNPLKVTGFVPQQQAGLLQMGQDVRVTLLDGRELEGELTFIASSADPETRSFRIETKVENPEQWRVAGGSATLRIEQSPVEALFLSPAMLSLDEEGRPGVLHVNDADEVIFTAVNLLSVGTEGAWVSGAPSPLRLITRGGGFVSAGQKVRPVLKESED